MIEMEFEASPWLLNYIREHGGVMSIAEGITIRG
jgi:hypothetical protein